MTLRGWADESNDFGVQPATRNVHNELVADTVSGVTVQAGVIRGDIHLFRHRVPRPQQLPSLSPAFVGRADQISQLTAVVDNATEPGRIVPILVLAGAGGIGKTALAVHWAHAHRERFPDGQLFVDLLGFSPTAKPMAPDEAVRGFLDALGVERDRIPAEPHAQSALFRSLIVDRRMLIVLDNAAAANQVIPLLPGAGSCVVLVTSRRTLTTLTTRHGAHNVRLAPLSIADAYTLLIRRLGEARVAAEPAPVRELVDFCCGFPLALSIIAARARTYPDIPLAEFAAELGELGLGALDDDDATTSLSSVLSWSYRSLNTEQQTLFVLLGISPKLRITPAAIASLTGQSLKRTWRVLRALEDASLLSRRAHQQFITHDMIRSYARDISRNLEKKAQCAARSRLIDFHLCTAEDAARLLAPQAEAIRFDPPPPGIHPEPLPEIQAALVWFDNNYASLMVAMCHAADLERHQAVWRLTWALAIFFEHDNRKLNTFNLFALIATYYGDYGLARQHSRAAVVLHRRHGKRHHEAVVLSLLADLERHSGDYQQTARQYDQALALSRFLGDTNQTADTLNSLGHAYRAIGQSKQAQAAWHEALELYREHGRATDAARIQGQLMDLAKRSRGTRKRDPLPQSLVL